MNRVIIHDRSFIPYISAETIKTRIVEMAKELSAQYADKISFASGAVSASFLFFFSLGFGARLLRPVFANPKAWKVLDLLIGCIMWLIALSLLR